jgi:hypothetical protein
MSFIPLKIENGLLADLSSDKFPCQVLGWRRALVKLPRGRTHFGIGIEGKSRLFCNETVFTVQPETFFVVPGETAVSGMMASGMIISFLSYDGLFQIGGPIEDTGRLTYIDGCSDTLLVCPPRLGEPCLNHLHIPPNTNQTAHTHPSVRIGVILRGRGECRTPDGCFDLQPGMGWIIQAGGLHSFHTADESLDVIAWHPDSDFGPTDENHPMINRTVIGV